MAKKYLPFLRLGIYYQKTNKFKNFKTQFLMLTLASIIYVFMCWISNWNVVWPITMVVNGGLGDKAIAIGWTILLVSAL